VEIVNPNDVKIYRSSFRDRQSQNGNAAMIQPVQATALPENPGYVDQSADNLGLELYGSFVEPARFQVFARRQDHHGGIRIQLNVIGASHLVNVEWEHQNLSELLACRPAGLFEPALALAAPISLGSRVEFQAPHFDYSFQLEREFLPPDTEKLPDRLLPQYSLVAAASFPGLPGSPAAMTAIGANLGSWESREGAMQAATLELRSVHWYQSESIAVMSRSLLRLYKGEKLWIEER